MSWPASLTVGVLTALVAGFLAGVVANLYADWYRITSFEGASGYFVVGMALIGAIVGAILGVVVSRWLTDPTFFTAIGASLGVVVVVLGVIAGVARLQADIPPTLDGHPLVLAVEVRWPAGRALPAMADSAPWRLRLSALRGRVVRLSEEGPLWREDARLEDDRWVLPGAVDVFTSRGKRMISFEPEALVGEGFAVPLPGRPGAEARAWSAWLPTSRDGSDQVQYRFRVVPANEPLRVEGVGLFEVATLGGGFALVRRGTTTEWLSNGRFEVRHAGRVVPLAALDAPDPIVIATAVAVVGGPEPALVAQVPSPDGGGMSILLRAVGDSVQRETIATGGASELRAALLTDDPVAYAAARDHEPATGRIDRVLLATPGTYLFAGAVLDTRSLTVRRFTTAGIGNLIERIPPLGASPDGRSLVRLGWAGEGDMTALLVIDLEGGEPMTVAIDRATMRYAELEQIEPAWLAHYFAWQPDASGRDRLVPRRGIVPLPHRGVLTEDGTGYREYRITPAGPRLREMFEEFLVEAFDAVPGERDPAAFSHTLRIGDVEVHVSYRAEDAHVGVWMDRGTDTRLVATIAERFDQELRNGRYDEAFLP